MRGTANPVRGTPKFFRATDIYFERYAVEPLTTDSSAWHAHCIRNDQPNKVMTHTENSLKNFESTYALIVRSEEKERSLSEGAVYLLITLSAVFSIWQMAQQPVTLPTSGVIHSSSAAPQQFRV